VKPSLGGGGDGRGTFSGRGRCFFFLAHSRWGVGRTGKKRMQVGQGGSTKKETFGEEDNGPADVSEE